MRPIPAPRIGDSHGLLRAIDERERLRLDEFVTDFAVEDLYPPELENALGRTRQFISFARAAGLCKEDRGIVELTEIGRRYIRAGDADKPFDVAPSQAEWLRRQLREKHMTDSIYHGLAISLSLLASSPGARVAVLDFGRALSYLGRAGWDNENTLQIQGERHLALLRDVELIDGERALTATGTELKAELTLPIHMSLLDLAAQLNPGGAEAVQQAGEAEMDAGEAAPTDEPAPTPEPVAKSAPVADEDEYQDVGPGAWAEPVEESVAPLPATPPPEPPAEPLVAAGDPVVAPGEPAIAPVGNPVVPAPEPEVAAEPVAAAAPEPVAPPPPPPPPPPDAREIAAPDDATRAIASVPPPPPTDPRIDAPTVVAPARTAFLPGSAIKAAATARGLRLAEAVFANVAAALDGGHHVLITGPPASGKTELALAIAQAAVDAGKASGANLVIAPDDGEVRDAARTGRWLVVDDLEAPPASSAFLGRLPVTLDGDERTAPESWRIVATATAAPANLTRFAVIETGAHPDLANAIEQAAQDPVAAAAAKRLLPLRDLTPLGAGPFLAAAAHAAARRAEAPADENQLAREVYAAYLAPHMGDNDARAREIVG